ncbi:NADP-specific glutamate dehydrogenase [Candidatus Saccharibacteria bacterium]|nr:NADP-specific glutamate dehydrogenase [Candidatus Saccharibacteria bacterium]
MSDGQTYVADFLTNFRRKHEAEPEFIQSVEELVNSLGQLLDARPDLRSAGVLERITEPERSIQFRVTWVADDGSVHVNRGYRVQFSSVLGPYKGGLRFHPSVNLSILQFLGFEQIFKNSLTGLWLGGGKGGSDFDPKDKSDAEIMRFCQAFITELANYIGPDTDIPAGDIGVGSREIGYLFGWYKKLANEFHGSLTGKGTDWGGSNLRPEATGYGLLYFVDAMLRHRGDSMTGKSVVISGSGNVAQYAAQKAIEFGAKVLTMSDSNGYIIDNAGIDTAKLATILRIKNNDRGRIKQYLDFYPDAEYYEGSRPWKVAADIYLPCATQNEIEIADAQAMVANKPLLVAEGANMPTTPEAVTALQAAGILFAPAKASNAGGVAVSGLEMAQNSMRTAWTLEVVDDRLKEIMQNIHDKCAKHGASNSKYSSNTGSDIDYVSGANISGFLRVADAMLSQGIF